MKTQMRPFFLWAMLVPFTLTAHASACQTTIPIPVGASVSVPSSSGWLGEVLAIEVDQPGWLAVQAEAVGRAENDSIWLEAQFNAQCAAQRQADGFWHGGWIEVKDPGAVFLRVGSAEAPLVDPEEVRLTTLWVPSRSFAGKDGEPGDETEEEDDEILPLVEGPPTGGCGRGEPWNDLRACSRPLAAGEGILDHLDGAAPDVDYHGFRVHALEQVHLVLEGEAHLGLYDDSGRLLAEGSSLQGPSRIVHLWTQLPEGRYFARVSGGSGPYRMLLETRVP